MRFGRLPPRTSNTRLVLWVAVASFWAAVPFTLLVLRPILRPSSTSGKALVSLPKGVTDSSELDSDPAQATAENTQVTEQNRLAGDTVQDSQVLAVLPTPLSLQKPLGVASALPLRKRIHIITYTNAIRSRSCLFFESALLHHLPVSVLGWNPEGPTMPLEYHLGSKLGVSHAFLKREFSHLPLSEQPYVMFVDAGDSFFQEGMAMLYKKLGWLACHVDAGLLENFVMFSTENDCWPPYLRSHYDRGVKLPTNVPILYKYLNGGGWIGTVKAAMAVLEAAMEERSGWLTHYVYRNEKGDVIHPPPPHLKAADTRAPYLTRNDQITLGEVFTEQKLPVTLDYSAILFQTMQLRQEVAEKQLKMRSWHPVLPPSLSPSAQRCVVGATEGGNTGETHAVPGALFNEEGKSFPSVLHYNGPSKELLRGAVNIDTVFRQMHWCKSYGCDTKRAPINASLIEELLTFYNYELQVQTGAAAERVTVALQSECGFG